MRPLALLKGRRNKGYTISLRGAPFSLRRRSPLSGARHLSRVCRHLSRLFPALSFPWQHGQARSAASFHFLVRPGQQLASRVEGMLSAVPSAPLKSGRETSSRSPPRPAPSAARRQLRSSSSPRARRRPQPRLAQVPQRRGHSSSSSSLTASFSGSSYVVFSPACFAWTPGSSLAFGRTPPFAVDAHVLWIATTLGGRDATLVFGCLHRARATCKRALGAGLRALAALLKNVLRTLARFSCGYGAKVRDACTARLGACLLQLKKAR
ncbi:hypothetical protein HPB51_020714 [Rhipicephalus microplus]|uniref:Uncharacterized protein n=1 Tax=Rhipicephalus microplus TaxID=6941 RepID=A0A9J6EIA7_RHIMP|nr:hypothetical protein HPB51_020714 [Rhipicephalus microplus]